MHHLFEGGVREAVALYLELGHVSVEDGEELLELLDDGGVVGGEDVDDLGADLLEQPRVWNVLLDELGRRVRRRELPVGLGDDMMQNQASIKISGLGVYDEVISSANKAEMKSYQVQISCTY